MSPLDKTRSKRAQGAGPCMVFKATVGNVVFEMSEMKSLKNFRIRVT